MHTNEKRKSLILGLFLGCFLLTGCRVVEVDMQSNVHFNGNVTRLITYDTFDSATKNEIDNRYVLPQNGSWNISQGKYEYQAKTILKYNPKQEYKDYNRKGLASKNLSSNGINLRKENKFFYTKFFYKETFSDFVNVEDVSNFCYEQYYFVINKFCTDFKNQYQDLDVKNLMITVHKEFDPLFQKFLADFLSSGYRFTDINLQNEIQDAISRENMFKITATYMPEFLSEEERDKKFSVLYEVFSEELSSFYDKLFNEFFYDKLGAYGVPVFENYVFRLSLNMPGKITKTNGKKKGVGTAFWKFDSVDFFANKYVMYAESIAITIENIIFYVFIFLVLIFAKKYFTKIRK